MAKLIPYDWERELPTPRLIYEHLDRYVIGQERAKRSFAISAYNHYKRLRRIAEPGADATLLRKSNLLLIGPSGCGKTHLARNISKVLNLPFAVVDATEYTEAGYYGKDVEVMLGELLHAADMDVEAAQRGVIFIDEVDKIARRNQGERTGAGARDIGGEGVQQSLLKLLEGTTCFVPYNLSQHWNKHDFVQMDTTNILFVLAGTFTDLKRGRSRRVSGFKREGPSPSGLKPLEDRVQVEDLLEYGMIAEFMGRVPVIVEMAELSEDELVRIITDPPDSILREYRELMAQDDIELKFAPEALQEIARCARRRKLGARALRSIFEDLMHDFMFEAPERRGQRLEIGAPDVLRKLR
jgi:ATP-dependent Clp protease ATP-binding subunit ClpX